MTSTIHRFFVSPGEMSGDSLRIPPSVSHQVKRVLRLRDGEELVLLDGAGGQAVCRIEGERLAVLRREPATGEPRHRLTICQALLKGDGLDRVVQQGTELGVAAFRLIVTERCVPRDISERRLERLRTIARESAEQSERGMVPEVEGLVSLASVLEPGAVLLFERLDASGVRLSAFEKPPSALIIGPEGGFTPDELAAARSANVLLGGLGPRILRAESVALAAAAVVLSQSGDFA